MVNKFEGVSFEHNGIGMNVPNDASFHMKDVHFKNNNVGFQMYDVSSQQGRLGLPLDTPNEVLLEVLALLKERSADKDLNPVETLKESKLWTYIQRASDGAAVIQKIIEIYQTPAITLMIASLTAAMR
ncbi:hypothetical protein [Pseudomonas sp. URMO17WK12:I12]|uniref:hypothetical protein n=1 Tax=Pseudomonas sp. URMO17WK12:I12 TaxID=1259797 RepID=UPI00047F6E77|nr:hypothetical protein [Pseudomonas sp. URMO17WK12:I12]